jgi:diguanylate cyclase (GGDEF)-like protein
MSDAVETPPKANILIVDDTPENLRILTFMLQRQGYKVRAVQDGELALTAAQAHLPDLIMLDVNMPIMDGYQTCERLKADPHTQDVPVIFISAMSDLEDKLKAFKVGGVDYVTKPFQMAEVLARVETHLAIRRLQAQLEASNTALAARLAELSVAQAAEREQRLLAEALRDTTAALNSTLNYAKVLELILTNLARVVPHDAASIVLLDAQGVGTVIGARGYREQGLEEFILSFRCPLAEFPNWRQAVETRRPTYIPDTSQASEWVAIPETSWVRSHAVVPISIQEQAIGLLDLVSRQTGFFTPELVARLQTFADQAAVAIEKARLFEETQRLAITDGLTGIYNRRHLFELAQREFVRALRYQRSLCLVMFDIDHFKKVNDTYGHPFGDKVLIAIARNCQAHSRSTDIFGRYGGEEFLLLMPETTIPEAIDAAERFRQQVAALVVTAGEISVSVTISLGVVALIPERDQSLEALIERVDQNLYAAKAGGRNQVHS